MESNTPFIAKVPLTVIDALSVIPAGFTSVKLFVVVNPVPVTWPEVPL